MHKQNNRFTFWSAMSLARARAPFTIIYTDAFVALHVIILRVSSVAVSWLGKSDLLANGPSSPLTIARILRNQVQLT